MSTSMGKVWISYCQVLGFYIPGFRHHILGASSSNRTAFESLAIKEPAPPLRVHHPRSFTSTIASPQKMQAICFDLSLSTDPHGVRFTLGDERAQVAACVCLFSLDKHEAIPVDTHVWAVAVRYYTPHLKGKSLTKQVRALQPVSRGSKP